MTDWKKHEIIAALASAHAEAGNWMDAIRYQKEAIEKSPEDGKKQVRAAALDRFEHHQPLRLTKQQLQGNVAKITFAK